MRLGKIEPGALVVKRHLGEQEGQVRYPPGAKEGAPEQGPAGCLRLAGHGT